MDEELDLVVFEDDDGNEVTMQVLDYRFYEGNEYALITEYHEDQPDADNGIFVMQVCPIQGDEENEEFVPIDESLAQKLVELFTTPYEEDDATYEDSDEE